MTASKVHRGGGNIDTIDPFDGGKCLEAAARAGGVPPPRVFHFGNAVTQMHLPH